MEGSGEERKECGGVGRREAGVGRSWEKCGRAAEKNGEIDWSGERH